jgi:hypothetical protein
MYYYMKFDKQAKLTTWILYTYTQKVGGQSSVNGCQIRPNYARSEMKERRSQ